MHANLTYFLFGSCTHTSLYLHIFHRDTFHATSKHTQCRNKGERVEEDWTSVSRWMKKSQAGEHVSQCDKMSI